MTRTLKSCAPELVLIAAIVVALVIMLTGCHFHLITVEMQNDVAAQAALNEVSQAFEGDAPIPQLPAEESEHE